jgi:tight adherence protein B
MGAMLGLTLGVGFLLIWRRPRPSLTRSPDRAGWLTRRDELIRRAGVDGVGPLQLLSVQLLCSLVVGAVILAITAAITVAACFALFAFVVPVLLLRRLRRRRQVALRELWPEAIDNLASACAPACHCPRASRRLHYGDPNRAPFAPFSAFYLFLCSSSAGSCRKSSPASMGLRRRFRSPSSFTLFPFSDAATERALRRRLAARGLSSKRPDDSAG